MSASINGLLLSQEITKLNKRYTVLQARIMATQCHDSPSHFAEYSPFAQATCTISFFFAKTV